MVGRRRVPTWLEFALVRLSLLGLGLLAWLNPDCARATQRWDALLEWAAVAGESGVAETARARWLFAVGGSVLLATTFWVINGALLLASRTGALDAWRIAVPQLPPPPSLIRECVLDALLGQLVVRPVLLYAVFPLFVRAGVPPVKMNGLSLGLRTLCLSVCVNVLHIYVDWSRHAGCTRFIAELSRTVGANLFVHAD